MPPEEFQIEMDKVALICLSSAANTLRDAVENSHLSDWIERYFEERGLDIREYNIYYRDKGWKEIVEYMEENI